MQWSLEKIYKEQVKGNIPPRKHLRVIGEDVGLYTKGEEGYNHIGDVSDDNFKKITRLASDGNAKDEIEDYLTKKSYTTDSFKGEDDYRVLVDLLDDGAFEEYIGQDKPSLEKNKLGNIINISSKVGLDTKMAERLARFTPIDKGGSNVGPGEILLALTFNDVSNSTIGGDLMLGDQKLEVKGQGGRFGQQPGRGGVAFSVNQVEEGLDKKLDLDNVVSLERLISSLYNAYKQEGKEKEFIPRLHETLKTAYPGADLNYLNNSTDFNDLGTRQGRRILPGAIRKALGKINFDYYSSKYDTDLYIFIDKKSLNYALFTKDDVLKDGGLIDQNILKSDSFSRNTLYPNFVYIFK